MNVRDRTDSWNGLAGWLTLVIIVAIIISLCIAVGGDSDPATPSSSTTTTTVWVESSVVLEPVGHGGNRYRCRWVRFQPGHVVDLRNCELEEAPDGR